MALSNLTDHNSYDYSFNYQKGAVKDGALKVTRLIGSTPDYQGSISIKVKIYGLLIPFSVSPKGLTALKQRKYVVKRQGGIGLSALKDLDSHVSKIVDNKPKVNI